MSGGFVIPKIQSLARAIFKTTRIRIDPAGLVEQNGTWTLIVNTINIGQCRPFFNCKVTVDIWSELVPQAIGQNAPVHDWRCQVQMTVQNLDGNCLASSKMYLYAPIFGRWVAASELHLNLPGRESSKPDADVELAKKRVLQRLSRQFPQYQFSLEPDTDSNRLICVCASGVKALDMEQVLGEIHACEIPGYLIVPELSS